jgi:phage protein D/phage baseplate assembly protein gpV
MSQPVRIAPVITVAGQQLSELALRQLDDLRISRGLRLPGRAILRFSDIGYTVAAGQIFSMGTALEVSTPDGTSLFQGEVTGVEMHLDRGQPEFTVIADDPTYKLTLGTKVRTFTKTSYAGVIGQIAGEHGLRHSVTGLTAQQDYLMQADSDFGFLNEIADRTGCDWWMDGGSMVFKPYDPAGTTVELSAETDLETFSVRATALHPGTATIRGWWPKTKQTVSADGTTAQNGSSAALVQPYLTASSLQSASATVSTADMPGDQAEAESLADRLMQRWTAGAVTAKGSCLANPLIAPGGSVSITAAGPASGTYHVSEVEHTYNNRGFETRFTAGDRRPSGLVDLLSGEQSSSFRRDGLVVGLVTMVGNGEGSAGDVKVKYPSVGGTVESNWARVVTLGAGAKRGITFIPEVNDEVIVGFEGGDARRPVVLGGLYNGQDVPVEFGVQNNAVSKRRITSRLGYFVEFSDGTDPASQHILLDVADGKHKVRLGKDKLEAIVPAGTPVMIKSGDAFLEIGQDGSITLSGQKITLKSKTDVEISGVNITAKASVKAAISGTMTEMKASATGEVSSGGAMTIKGAMVAVN